MNFFVIEKSWLTLPLRHPLLWPWLVLSEQKHFTRFFAENELS